VRWIEIGVEEGRGEVKKWVLLIAAAALAMSGCAKTPFPVLEAKLGDLKGHPAKEVFDKFGDPTERQTNPERAYVWILPTAGGAFAGLQCTVTVFVDKNDKIVRYDFTGDVGGCGYYAHQLDNTYHRAQGILDF
jgi:hypothetical protein